MRETFFGEDVARFHKAMLTTAFHKRFSSFEEDLAQEAVVSALEQSDRFDPSRGSFTDFAYYVARSVAIDRIRRLRRPVTTPVRHKLQQEPIRWLSPDGLEVAYNDAEQDIQGNELISLIAGRICATTKLDSDEATAVVEVWLADSKKSVAERRGLSLDKLTDLVNTARRALRKDKKTLNMLRSQG